MLEFVDSHCHIHDPEYGLNNKKIISRARENNVNHIICVGTDCQNSQLAVDFAGRYKKVWASVGLHPHEADKFNAEFSLIKKLALSKKVVAIGECGLDYFYKDYSREIQFNALERQLSLAEELDLPLIFHVREAFHDFWPIIDNYKDLKGVFHCFSTNLKDLEDILSRGFFVGLNGIVTFSKNTDQLEAFKAVPLNKMILETDAPYLTPVPFRGHANEPKYIPVIAEFLSKLRGEPVEDIAQKTTRNCRELFGLNM